MRNLHIKFMLFDIYGPPYLNNEILSLIYTFHLHLMYMSDKISLLRYGGPYMSQSINLICKFLIKTLI